METRFLGWQMMVFSVLLILSAARTVLADCDDDGGMSDYKVCAAWASGDPEHDVHYIVTFNDPDPPDVELVIGRDDWTIYVQATVGGAPASLGTLSTSSSANFTVKILGPGNTPGAVNVATIDLQPTGNFRSSLAADSRISGNLTGALTLQATSGGSGGELYLQVDGDMSGTITVPKIRSLTILNNLPGDLLAADVNGTVTVIGDVTSTADIEIDNITAAALNFNDDVGSFDGDLVIDADIPSQSSVSLGGYLADNDGTVTLGGNDIDGQLRFPFGFNGPVTGINELTGQIDIGGGSATTEFAGSLEIGSISSSGFIRSYFGEFGGQITVTGNVAGLINLEQHFLAGGGIDIGGNLTGLILIGGDLKDDGTAAHEITIDGTMGAAAAIAVDYEGWDAGDDWESGATVSVDAATYTGNTPEAFIWEITECKGDMNNDDAVDSFDADPLLLALLDSGDFSDYRDAYPGLIYSVVYHGDFVDTCDVLDFFDVDPFVAELFNQCCPTECDQEVCEPFGPGGGTPAAAAELLDEALDGAELDAWVTAVQSILSSLSEPRQEFWADVFDILGYD